MRVTEITPPKGRVFTVEMSEDEMRLLDVVLGNRGSTDSKRDGVDYDKEFLLYRQINDALEGA